MRYQKRNHQEGMALVAVTLAAVIVFGAVTLVVAKVQTNKRFTDVTVQRAVVDEAAKSGIDSAIATLWQAYVTSNGNTTGNWASYRVFLNNFPIANNEDLDHSGGQTGNENDENGDGNFEVANATVLVDTANVVELANSAFVDSITVNRTDDLTGTTLTITARANYGTETRTAIQTVRVAGLPFDGFQFAVLANNISCIMCHAEFRQVDLELNTDPTQYNSFDRIKIASLESLRLKTGGADSNIAGTLYSRGNVIDHSTALPLSTSDIANSTMKAYDFTNTNGKIVQDTTSGDMTKVDMAQAGLDAQGLLDQFSNLYQNYPADVALQTDGPLPSSFPAPFPDDDGDRVVDASEFTPVVNSAEGSISGGVVHGVPHGSTYADTSLPSSSNSAATDMTANGHYDGNLVLVGTESNPIVLDGKVTVAGDVMISGKVEGFGQILAQNNAYVMGDVTYNDAPGEFGVTASGTENGLALIAGGSIMMGDYLTIRGKNHTQVTGNWPTKGQRIDVSQANVNGTVSKNGTSETVNRGYFDAGVIDAGESDPNMFDLSGNQVPRQGQQYSFTTSQLQIFNQLEVDKAAADASYVPRLYGLRDSQPGNIYTRSGSDGSSHYDSSRVSTLAQYIVAQGYDPSIMTRATYQYMSPMNAWISEENMREIWWDDEQARPSSGQPFSFDGLLYSNNAIFSNTRGNGSHNSNTFGRMNIRGGFVSADLGMLIPGNEDGDPGLYMNYDPRVRRFFEIEDVSQVGFSRLVFRYQ